MSIKDVFGTAFRVIRGLVPKVMELSGLFSMLLNTLVVAVAQRDVPKIEKVAETGIRLGDAFVWLGEEIRELFDKIGQSVQPDSDGGVNLTGNELKAIADEADDIDEPVVALTKEIAELQADIRAIL